MNNGQRFDEARMVNLYRKGQGATPDLDGVYTVAYKAYSKFTPNVRRVSLRAWRLWHSSLRLDLFASDSVTVLELRLGKYHTIL